MHSDRLILAETLIAAIDCGSFTKAAELLGVSQSTVSRRIADLEARLGGTPLFQRGTRWIDPTPEAQTYVREIREVMGRLETIEAGLRDVETEPQGLLRVSLPPAIGRAKLLLPLAQLAQRYSKLELKIELSEAYVDLRDGTIDLAVRIRPVEQTGIVVEKIGESRIGLYASPDYLATAPELHTPADIAKHSVIGLTSFFQNDLHSLPRKQMQAYAEIRPTILANDLTGVAQLMREGLGLGFAPDHVVAEDVASGRLVNCGPNLPIPPVALFALFPYGSKSSARVQAALTTVREALLSAN